MRVKSLILLTLLLILASCAGSDEPQDAATHGAPIEFSSSSNSRASESLPTSYKMWTTSIYHGERGDNLYLKEEPVTYDNINEVWRCNDCYYPLSGGMDFFAIGASGGEKPNFTYTPDLNSTNLSSGQSFSSFKFELSEAPNRAGYDIIMSDVVKGVDCGKDTPAVPLHFKRLLANVRFTFTAATSECAECLMVTGVFLRSVRNSGYVNISVDQNGETSAGLWYLSNTTKNLLVNGLSIRPKHNSPDAPVPVDYFLPPQNYIQEGASVSLVVKLRYNVSSPWQKNSLTLEGPEFAASPGLWVSGGRYTYNCNITMLPVWRFRVTITDESTGAVVADWITESIDVDLP